MIEKQKVDKNLEQWLTDRADADFPGKLGDSYKNRYPLVAKRLIDVHNEVEKGAIISAIKDGTCAFDQIPYLNNHGVEHAAQVIQKASELLEKCECTITPYEGYLLLMAIQFHDVGNIYGRREHETKCWEILNALGTEVGTDTPEKRAFIRIASVHGGLSASGTSDTIATLEQDPFDVMGQSIRSRLLAAILRFSDELADDYTRTSSTDFGNITNESKIYHMYSRCLHSVIVEKDEIRLKFEIEEEQALEQFSKKNTSVFLIDEIYSRTLKMFTELLYCSRFMRANINIERIKVHLSIYPSKSLAETIKIEYTLQENGYPSHLTNICMICPNLNEQTGQQIKEQILAWRSSS